MAGAPSIKREEDVQEDWLITYADAITLLMCFFVLMYSISEPSQEKFEEVAGGLVAWAQVQYQWDKRGQAKGEAEQEGGVGGVHVLCPCRVRRLVRAPGGVASG